MRIDKTSGASVISSDTIALANRFEERRNRIEAELQNYHIDPAMRGRVNALFADLRRSLAARDLKPTRSPTWREMTPEQAIDRLAEQSEAFLAPPVVSAELRAQFEGEQ